MSKLRIGNSEFEWGKKTYLVGIINVTPDSFSGDGLMTDGNWIDRAVEQGRMQETDGAHMLDVGGESTRPGSTPVSLEEELRRVIPVIEALAKVVKVPISIDTYRAETARRALDAGAKIINDVWSFKMDVDMPKVAAQYGTVVILMHNRSKPKQVSKEEALGGRYVGMEYDDLVSDIKRELLESAQQALDAGISKENIILDPGIGFGKTVEQNLELVYRLREFDDIGYPLLVGLSRKSFVGYTLNLPPEERLEGTAAAVALCIERGADIVRVHDVKAMNRVVTFTDAVVRGRL